MKILNRYLTKGFLQCLLLVMPALVGIYLIVDLFEKIDEFIEQDVSAIDTITYFFMRMPQIIYDLFPVSILIAGVIFFSILIRNLEFIAMEAVGISPKRLIRPVASVSFWLASFMLLFHAFVIGRANIKAKILWEQEIEGVPSYGSSTGMVFFRGNRTIWSFGQLQAGGSVLFDVNLIVFKKDYSCYQIIKAKKAVYANGKWSFIDGMRLFCEEKNSIGASTFHTITLSLKDKPSVFSRLYVSPKEMGLYQLGNTILEYKELGIYDRELEANFWNRLFYPFFGVALLLFGLSVLTIFQRGGIGLGIVLGLAISFGGWALWNLFSSWGETGRISPMFPPVMLISTILIVQSYLQSRWR